MFEFRVRARFAGAGPQAVADLLPTLGQNDIDGPLGYNVARDLSVAQSGFKLADKIGGADNLFAQPAQKLDRARIDHGDVHDGVVGRVLHGQRARAGQHRFQAGGQFLPA